MRALPPATAELSLSGSFHHGWLLLRFKFLFAHDFAAPVDSTYEDRFFLDSTSLKSLAPKSRSGTKLNFGTPMLRCRFASRRSISLCMLLGSQMHLGYIICRDFEIIRNKQACSGQSAFSSLPLQHGKKLHHRHLRLHWLIIAALMSTARSSTLRSRHLLAMSHTSNQ